MLSPGTFGAESSAETHQPGEESAQGDQTSVFRYLEKGCGEGRHSSAWQKDRRQWAQVAQGKL